MRFCTSFLALVLTAGMALAANVSGKWSGEYKLTLPDGTIEPGSAQLDLQQSGATVTGRLASEPEMWLTIQNGRIAQGTLSFEVTYPDGRVIKLRGRLATKTRFEGKAEVAPRGGGNTPLIATFVFTREAATPKP